MTGISSSSQFKRWLESLYEGTLELDYKSCEMIADDLYNEISAKYPGRFVEIDVVQDGENGCSIFYPNPMILLEGRTMATQDL